MIEVEIREVHTSDRTEINEINQLVAKEGVHDLRSYASDEDLEVYASEEDYEFFVAVSCDKLIGYVEMHYYEVQSMILQLFVHPNFRNKGVGRKLINRLITEVQSKARYLEIYLQVKEGSRAIGLYKSEGFVEAKKVKDGVEMVRKI